jgi:uncharacterized protein
MMLRAAIATMALVSWPTVAVAQPPNVRTLTEQEMLDMMMGSSIQASRGNNTASLVQRVKEAIAQGRKFTIIATEDLPDDWTTVTPAGVGGGGAWEYVRERVKQQNLPIIPNASQRAIEVLGKHLGKTFDAVVRIEAAGATLSALLAASELGVPLVDACLSGRARPEIQQQVPWLIGLPSTPAALVTRFGDSIIIDRAADDYRSEDLARAIAVASGGGASMAMNVMTGRDLKRGGAIPGAVSQAILLGRTAREAVARRVDPIAALVSATKGFKLFQGTVTKMDGKGDRGFTWWDVELTGTKEYSGHTYRIWIKNENNVAWLDGMPDAMAPDFIANLDPLTGDAHVGGELGSYKRGAEVAIIGWPASPLWRTAKGIEVFGPRHFGFDFDYVPIEQLQKQRKAMSR